MPKLCDHKAAGMLVWKNDSLLLIERLKGVRGFAPPAGHVDDDPAFENTARRELEEETGMKAISMKLISEGRKDNRCSRKDGLWHYWKIFNVEAEGTPKADNDEPKSAGWFTKDDLLQLAKKTESYVRGEIPEEDWINSPGLEPVWREWFRELHIN